MRIGIISDTHGFVHPDFAQHFAGGERILHAGDIGSLSVLKTLEAIAPTIAVRGNIDGEEFWMVEQLKRVKLGGKHIAIVHHAGDPLRPYHAVHHDILTQPTDILISGHYHAYWCTPLENPKQRPPSHPGHATPKLWINPGAAGNHGHHDQRTALILKIDEIAPQHQTIVSLGLEKIALGPRFS